MLQLEQELKSNAYPGRGIVIGRSANGKYAVTAYFIMGRSANSRNRVGASSHDKISGYSIFTVTRQILSTRECTNS